jgi:hypothetical protein
MRAVSPLSIQRTAIWLESSPEEIQASRSPPGDQRGCETLLSPASRGRCAPLSTSTSHSSLRRRLRITSIDTRT